MLITGLLVYSRADAIEKLEWYALRDLTRVGSSWRCVPLALVAAADDEIVATMVRVEFEDAATNRLAADLDHGLGPKVGS